MAWKTGTKMSTGSRPMMGAISLALQQRLTALSSDHAQTTVAESIADVLVNRALSGDMRAIREIADRTEGRPTQQLRVDVPAIEESSLDISRLTDEQMRRLDEILQAAKKD